jgi:hypothetical protein
MSNGPIEPNAELRTLANTLHQMFVALTQEGFTEQQALVIIGQILAANGGGQ